MSEQKDTAPTMKSFIESTDSSPKAIKTSFKPKMWDWQLAVVKVRA